jgi:hypothetical protein
MTKPNTADISRRLRFEILRRDNHQCRYCGAAAPEATLTVDHVIPRALGGSDDPTNLVAACVSCNGGKTSVAPDQSTVEDVSSRQLAWADALKQAAELSRAEMNPAPDPTVQAFEAMWDEWKSGDFLVYRPHNWDTSVSLFVQRGFTADDFRHFIRVAMKNGRVGLNDKFRYFCGCCWKELARREELAGEIMRASIAAEPDDGEYVSNRPTPAMVEDGVELFTNPDCGDCQGKGYINDGDETAECWCLSKLPYTSEVY